MDGTTLDIVSSSVKMEISMKEEDGIKLEHMPLATTLKALEFVSLEISWVSTCFYYNLQRYRSTPFQA